jgi:hypothetical protein
MGAVTCEVLLKEYGRRSVCGAVWLKVKGVWLCLASPGWSGHGDVVLLAPQGGVFVFMLRLLHEGVMTTCTPSS